MADVLCPTCGKSNPVILEICQYCGTVLKKEMTEPLAPLKPGEMPVKKATSDLERTLPTWLRDIRKNETPPDPTAPRPAVTFGSNRVDAPGPIGQSSKPKSPSKAGNQSPLDMLAGLSQSAEDEDEIPDWLANLKSDTPETPSAPAAPQETPEKPVTDWLTNFRADEDKPQQLADEPEVDWGFSGSRALDLSEPAEPAAEIPIDTPDWLSALKAQDQTATPPDAKKADSAEFGELSDWFSGIQSESPQTQAPPKPAPKSSEGMSDWLSDLAQESTLSAKPAPIESGPAGEQPFNEDLPDWLSTLKAQDQTATPPDAEKADSSQFGDVSDWFSGIQSESTQKPAPPPFEPAPEPDEDALPFASTPDWLSNMAQESTSSAKPAPVESSPAGEQSFSGDLPDWLSGMQSESPAQKPSAPAFTEPSTGDLTDWLSGLDQEPAAPAARQDLPAASELPDWLSGISAAAPSAADAPAAFQTDEPVSAGFVPPAESLPDDTSSNGDMPDWLSAAIGDKPDILPPPPTQETHPKPKQPKPAKAFPADILDDMEPGRADETPDWQSGLQSTPAGETLDWLAGLQSMPIARTPQTTEPAQSTPPAETPQTTEPAWPAPASQEDSSPFGDFASFGDLSSATSLPDWMSGFSDAGASVAGKETPAETGEKAEAESEFVAPPVAIPTSTDEQNLDSMFSEDVPDWLSNFTPAENETSVAELEQGATASDLGQAELPSWVQAMRPMESMLSADAGGDDEQGVEQNGPLAGLRNVLPPRLDPLEIRKPKLYSIKLQVTGTQQSQATLMQKLVESEALSQPISTPKRVLVMRPLRWVIAAVLLLAVLLPAMLGSTAFPVPYIRPEETTLFQETVQNLPEASPVLVVFDYQPGYAGEMESAASPVIDHLMTRKALLSFVSSSPSGVLMGERMMATQNLRRVETPENIYQMGAQYVDLGYLPGGAAGIQVFATHPRETLGRDSLLGDLWERPALQGVTINGVTQLSNFAALIVLTDNPDTGRMWVEQAGPALGDKPLMMVISAQAEPMIRPYYISGQLRGMVTGLEGGAMYEDIIQRPEQARQYWDSYGLGMIASELLIVIGGAWALVTGLRERGASQEEDEA